MADDINEEAGFFRKLERVDDRFTRVNMLASRIDQHRVAMSRLAIRRAYELQTLRMSHSVPEIAERLGITRQQVYRLIREADGREEAPDS